MHSIMHRLAINSDWDEAVHRRMHRLAINSAEAMHRRIMHRLAINTAWDEAVHRRIMHSLAIQ